MQKYTIIFLCIGKRYFSLQNIRHKKINISHAMRAIYNIIIILMITKERKKERKKKKNQ